MRLKAWGMSLAVGLAIAASGGPVSAEGPRRPSDVLTPAEVAGIRSYVGRPLGELAENLELWGAVYRVVETFKGPAWAPYDFKRPLVSVFEFLLFLDPFPVSKKKGRAFVQLSDEYPPLEASEEERFIFGYRCFPRPHVPDCSEKAALVIDVESGHVAVALFPLDVVKKKGGTDHPVMFIKACAPPELEAYARKRFAAWFNPAIADGDLDFLVPYTIDLAAKIRCRTPGKSAKG